MAIETKDKLVTLEDLKASHTYLKSGINDLEEDKAPVIASTAAGSVASFSDGSENVPLKDLKIKIEPIQTGSGTPSSTNIRPLKRPTAVTVWLAAERPKTYGVKWDGTTAQMTRTGDASGITVNTANFKVTGSVSSSYDNPFDSIYPWSERKLCNISLMNYMALTPQNKLKDCVTAFDDEAGFSYADNDGVWVYTPPFWGRSYTDIDGKVNYEVSDKPQKGFLYYPEMITARWRGTVESRTIDGTSKNVLLSKTGMPGKSIAMSTLHGYAKNYGGSVTTIYSIDTSYLLMLVEYANFCCRNVVGGGVNDVYRQNSDKFTAASSDSTQVTISNAYTVQPNYIFDIGTSNGGTQVGSYYVVSVATSGSNQIVTLDRAATVTTDNFWSIHGMINTSDSQVGRKSGYIGTNNKSHAYYRGEELWGNLWMYCLGAYKQASTNNVYLCPLDKDPDNYSSINTTDHVNTGVVLSASNGWQKTIAAPDNSDTSLAAAILTTSVGNGADSNGPIGAYFYTNASANTIPIVGGGAGHGSGVGLSWNWALTAGYSYWDCGASPRLKSPEGVVRGSALPMTA